MENPRSLLLGRILRLSGAGLLIGWMIASMGISVIGFSGTNPPAWAGPVLVIVILGGGMLAAMGAGLLWIGEKISGPDAFLDSWLAPWRTRRGVAKPRPAEEDQHDIWATVTNEKGLGPQLRISGKCFVEFERDLLFLGQPGKDLVLLEPKKVIRINEKILEIDTGRWNYGKITLAFESSSDANELQTKVMSLLGKQEKN